MDNALEILKNFTYAQPAWGVRELAKKLNMSHSIVYRVLATFEEHGFLRQNEETQKYELGIKFWEYGQIAKSKLNVIDLILPSMETLASETGESIFLTWIDGLEGICLEIAESSQKVKFAVTIGSRTPLYAGASNKVIMAYLPPEKQEVIITQGLQEITTQTIINPDELRRNLEEIRRLGWCFSIGEYSEEVIGLAVPLFTGKGQIVGSLTVAAPEYRFPESKVKGVTERLLIKAREVQSHLDTIP